MDYKVILSRPAIRDLAGIARYIAADDPAAAERVGLELVALAESLATMPSRGRVLRGRPGSRRLVSSPYLVTYRIDEAKCIVYVQRFWHAKRDPETWRAD
jgi:plasmid stabilization system protein ParE